MKDVEGFIDVGLHSYIYLCIYIYVYVYVYVYVLCIEECIYNIHILYWG